MKILILSNKGPKCGISESGKQLNQALLGLGHEVTLYNADYPSYGPSNMGEFDVLHLNFYPSTLGHIQPQHLPKDGPLISAFFHEVDPKWGPGHPAPMIWDDESILKFTSEPTPKSLFFYLPVPDYKPKGSPSGERIRIGHTGIRGDGLDRLEGFCEVNKWALSKSSGWVNLEDEIERLAACHLVVSHSHSAYEGQSSSVLTAIASRRPVLTNSGKMLKHINDLNKTSYGGSQLYCIEDMEEGIRTILHDLAFGSEKTPNFLASDFSWARQARWMMAIWEKRLKCGF